MVEENKELFLASLEGTRTYSCPFIMGHRCILTSRKPLRQDGEMQKWLNLPACKFVGWEWKSCSRLNFLNRIVEEMKAVSHRRWGERKYNTFKRLAFIYKRFPEQAFWYILAKSGINEETIKVNMGRALAAECLQDESCPFKPIAEGV